MYLVDTNIFLEILLKQKKSEWCKTFLDSNYGAITISDFTLHSIGVILFRQNEQDTFHQFISDILPKVNLLSLPKDGYKRIAAFHRNLNLDFDDSYQYCICKHFNLKFVTMDQDFKNIKDLEIQLI